LLFAGLSFLILAMVMVFRNTMYRNPKKKRTRSCTNLKDESQMRMFDMGIKWAEQFKDKTTELHMVHQKLNLYGEYIDFGHDKCAVILQGRTESLLYSYYFADAYAKNGYNILTVDVRSHGLSDGKYQTAGIKESSDLIAWINLIKEKYGIENFVVHGICVGAATAIYAYSKLKKQGNNLIKKIITDGLFTTNFEIFKRNFAVYKKKPFPILHLVFMLGRILARVRMFKETPIKYIADVDIPILMIYSAEDIFAVTEKQKELFDACSSECKQLAIFPHGRHSHVRATQEDDYDRAIEEFLNN